MSPRATPTPISRSVVTVVLVIHTTIIPVMVGLCLIPPLLGAKILLVVRSKFGRVVKGSLGGETFVLRTFRMSKKELVKERVSQRKS